MLYAITAVLGAIVGLFIGVFLGSAAGYAQGWKAARLKYMTEAIGVISDD